MKRAIRESHRARRLALLSSLGLIMLSSLASRSAAGDPPQEPAWQATLNPGGTLRAGKPLELTDDCKEPILWSVQSNKSFIRFDRQVASILVNPGASEMVGIIFDAAGLKEGMYYAKVVAECTNCKGGARCGIKGRREFVAKLTVVKPTSTTEGRKETSQQLQATLVRRLKDLSSLFERRIQGLEVVTGLSPNGKPEQGYDRAAVGGIFKEVREGLRDATKEIELRAFGVYAWKHYDPERHLVLVSVRTKEAGASLESRNIFFPTSLRSRAFRGPLKDRLIVTLASANVAFNSVRGLLAVLMDNTGPITLKVISVPDGANIVLVAPGGKTYSRPTNSDITDFFRGTYRITVSKEGFKTIVQDDQDVGFGDTVIECQLVTSGQPIFCKLR